jgi:uncharacterized membrane protein YGL010W
MGRLLIATQQAYALGIHAAVGAAVVQARDFEREMVVYGVYHQNPINQVIHFIFSPLIWFSFVVLHCYLPVLGIRARVGGHEVTWGTLTLLTYLT